MVKAGTWSKLLETRNKRLVFAIALSLILAIFSLFYLCSYLLFSFLLSYYICVTTLLLIVGLSVFSHLSKKAIVHLNSYLEKLRGEVLELLIGNPASLLVLS